jgi:hypothetical protein
LNLRLSTNRIAKRRLGTGSLADAARLVRPCSVTAPSARASLGVAVAVAVLLVRSRAEAGGFTAELAAGVSNAILVGPPDDVIDPGFAPVLAALGWHVTARLAVGLRAVNYLIPATVAGRRELFVASTLGPAAAMWPGARLVVGVAIGPCLVWPAPGASPYLRANRGVGVSLRAGWSIARAAGGDVVLGGELLPDFFAGGDVLVGTLITVGLLWR